MKYAKFGLFRNQNSLLRLAFLVLTINLIMTACGENSPTIAPTATKNIASSKIEATVTVQDLATSTPVVIATVNANSPIATSPVATNTPQSAPTATTQSATPTQVSTAQINSTSSPNTTASLDNTTATTPAGITPVPTVSMSPSPDGYTGKISIVGNDNAIYVLRMDNKQSPQVVLGKAGQLVSSSIDGELFFWPTWSSDGTKLAAYGVNVAKGAPTSSDTYVVNSDGSGRYKLQDQIQSQPLFLSWSPDGNFLSVLLNKDSVLELNVADTSKSASGKPASLRQVVSGGPIFSHWGPDSDSLLVRSGDGDKAPNSLGIFHAKSAGANISSIPATPGNFRTPSFTSDGKKYAFSTISNDASTETINIQGKDGSKLATIPLNGSGAAFNFSPDGGKIAHSYSTGNAGSYKGISLNDISHADNGVVLKPVEIVSEPILAFWWSPDGKKLAYIGGNDTADALTWKVYDVDTKKSTLLTEWIPSREGFQLIAYFDQYAVTDSIWSPDSKAIVFNGYAGAYLKANAGKPSGETLTYLLPVSGPNTGKVQAIEPGKLAFWSK